MLERRHRDPVVRAEPGNEDLGLPQHDHQALDARRLEILLEQEQHEAAGPMAVRSHGEI